MLAVGCHLQFLAAPGLIRGKSVTIGRNVLVIVTGGVGLVLLNYTTRFSH